MASGTPTPLSRTPLPHYTLTMPLQNRCTPDGTLEATTARGLFMGNRGGRIHLPDRTLGRARWKSRAWIICVLEFNGWHREVMGAGYTEVFFVDEATALAAGHRPCYLCQRSRALAFAEAIGGSPKAPQIDQLLHAERRAQPTKIPFKETAIPGAMIRLNGRTWLVGRGGLRPWSHHGYGPAVPLPDPDTPIERLTPATTARALANGYRPALHPSANPDSGTA